MLELLYNALIIAGGVIGGAVVLALAWTIISFGPVLLMVGICKILEIFEEDDD